MTDKKINQKDSEALLANPAFQRAIDKFRQLIDDQAMVVKTPDESFRWVVAKQMSEQLLRTIQSEIDDGLMHTYSEQLKSEAEERKNPNTARPFIRR